MNAQLNKFDSPRPVIGISVDHRENTASSGKYEVATAYSRCVAEAGGVPVLLPHEPGMAAQFVRLCDGVVLTGGGDPATEAFGYPTHKSAKRIDATRQAFELALLAELDRQPDKPVLGICLGMQMMALHSGATLHQHLPDVLGDADLHLNDNRHAVTILTADSVLTGLTLERFLNECKVDRTSLRAATVRERTKIRAKKPLADARGSLRISHAKSENALLNEEAAVVSWHHQAVACGDGTAGPDPKTSRGAQAGRMRVVATAPDGVVEAVDDPERRFYVGVQWHPERGGAGPLNQGLFDRLVSACRQAK